MVFFAGRGWNRIDTRRMTQDFVFAHERRRSDLGDHESRMQATVRRKKWSEPTGEVRIHQLFDPPLADVGQLRDGNCRKIERKTEILTVEISSTDQVCRGQFLTRTVFEKDQRIVSDRVD